MSQNSADQKKQITSQAPQSTMPLLLSAPRLTSALKSRPGQIVAGVAIGLLLLSVWYFSHKAIAPSVVVQEVSQNATPALAAGAWIWKDMVGSGATTTPRLPGDTAIVLSAEGAVYLDTDCNTYRGTWTATGTDSLSIAVSPSTKIACPSGSRSEAMAGALASAKTYTINGEMLSISTVDGGVMNFTSSHYVGTFVGSDGSQLEINGNGHALLKSYNGTALNSESGMWGTGNGGRLLVTLTLRNEQKIAPVTVVFESTDAGVRGVSPAPYAGLMLNIASTTKNSGN